VYDSLLLRTGGRIVVDEFAGPVGDKEDGHSRRTRSGDKLDNTRNRYGWVLLVEVIQLAIGKWTFERDLKVDVADDCLINVKNNSGRQAVRFRVAWHRTPRFIVYESR
jgi:hypothetical protein